MLEFCLPAEFYDLIVSEFTLHHLPEFSGRRVALSRIYAALKPGANFYFAISCSSACPTAPSATSS